MAEAAGFDGADIKSCHRYLLSELMSAYTREGRYGGSYENRTRMLRETIGGAVQATGSEFIVGTRVNVYDGFEYPYGFAVKEGEGITPDYTESKQLMRDLVAQGAGIINMTMGNPYFNPHVNRPYSRGGWVQGLRGIWMEDGHGIFLEGGSEDPSWAHKFQPDKEYLEKYEHPLWKEYREFGLRGGHGGMDYLVLRAFVESIQNNVEFPIDVYDTASWMAITCLSEDSIAKGGAPVSIPDFTRGKWMKRQQRPGDMFSLDRVVKEAFEE
jgi:hypothetical protein